MYSKMTRKVSKKVIMNGKRRRPMVSARIKLKSRAPLEWCRAIADSSRTGRMNSSVVMTIRKMHPKTASAL